MTEITEGPWTILMRVPLMRIDGKAYRETPCHEKICGGCAFEMPGPLCGRAEDISEAAFGGNCLKRDVIYEEVPNS